MAYADDERPVIALHADRFIITRSPLRTADVVGPSDAGFDEELRNACREHRALLHVVVGEREIPVIANQRRPDESRVGVVASSVDAEWRAKQPPPRTAHEPAGPDQSLGV